MVDADRTKRCMISVFVHGVFLICKNAAPGDGLSYSQAVVEVQPLEVLNLQALPKVMLQKSLEQFLFK